MNTISALIPGRVSRLNNPTHICFGSGCSHQVTPAEARFAGRQKRPLAEQLQDVIALNVSAGIQQQQVGLAQAALQKQQHLEASIRQYLGVISQWAMHTGGQLPPVNPQQNPMLYQALYRPQESAQRAKETINALQQAAMLSTQAANEVMQIFLNNQRIQQMNPIRRFFHGLFGGAR